MFDRLRSIILIVSLGLLAAACGGAGPGPANASRTIPNPQPANPSATPLPSPTATPPPAGPCDNPLMSLRVGNEWLYTAASPLGSSTQVLRVEEWQQGFDLNALVAMENPATGARDTDLVTCRAGLLEDFPLFFISMQLGDFLDGVLNTFYESGVYAPSYAAFAENNWLLSWQARYLTEQAVSLKNIAEGISLGTGISSPVDLLFETSGVYEPLTVPAGEFPRALKVSFTFTLATVVTYPSFSAGAPLTIHTTQWYAPFIGLIRSQVDTATVDLIPNQPSTAPITSVIELVQFNLAP